MDAIASQDLGGSRHCPTVNSEACTARSRPGSTAVNVAPAYGETKATAAYWPLIAAVSRST